MASAPEQAGVGWSVSPSALKIEYVRKYAVGKRALDLGAGRGWYASVLADMSFEVTAIDQQNRVEDNRIRVIEQSITPSLPFEDGAFDTVLMFDILEHLPDETALLAEISRVCAGRLILSVPHSDDGFLPQYGLTYLHHIDDTHLREYTPDGLAETLKAQRFQPLKVALVGQPTIPLVFSEFVRGGPFIRQMLRYFITALYRIGLVYNKEIAGDIFYVGQKES